MTETPGLYALDVKNYKTFSEASQNPFKSLLHDLFYLTYPIIYAMEIKSANRGYKAVLQTRKEAQRRFDLEFGQRGGQGCGVVLGICG